MKLEDIDKLLDAQKQIIHILHPLPDRAKKRILTYFSDVTSDPDANQKEWKMEAIKEIANILGLEKP